MNRPQNLPTAYANPIPIETDFISHDGDQPCKDISCPCHSDRFVEVALSEYATAQYDRHAQTVIVTRKGDPWDATFIDLSHEETYRLLALLHAEMPASSK